MSVSLAINPITWTNDDMPELGGDIPLEVCLALHATLGIERGLVVQPAVDRPVARAGAAAVGMGGLEMRGAGPQALDLRAEQMGASIAEIAFDVGYGSEAAFSRAFKRISGVTPGSIRPTA